MENWKEEFEKQQIGFVGLSTDFDSDAVKVFISSQMEKLIEEAGNISMEAEYADRKERLIELRKKYLL